MSFPENLKEQIRKRAMFRCCRCQSIGIDVHHVIPQKDGGSDDFDNAAPLCQNCHDQFGDNPNKRKEIRQMRNHWYETVAQMYPNQTIVSMSMLGEINEKLEKIEKGQEDLSELKDILEKISDKTIDSIKSDTASSVVSGIVGTAMAQSVRLGDKVHANFRCANCGAQIGLLIGSNACPNCKQPI